MEENTKKSVYDIISEVEKVYKEKFNKILPEEVKLEKLEVDTIDNNELEKLAKASLEEIYNTKINNLKTIAGEKKTALEEETVKTLNNAETKKAEIQNNYDEAKSELQNQALKRGLGRSSIIMGQLEGVEKDKINQTNNYSNEVSQKIQNIETELKSLEEGLSKSLKSLDMEKAVELNEKIEELKNQKEKEINNAIKYNNSVTESEIKYNNQLKVSQKTDEYINLVNEKERQTAGKVLDYYLEYEDLNEALNELQNDEELKSKLGNYYKYCVNVIKQKIN